MKITTIEQLKQRIGKYVILSNFNEECNAQQSFREATEEEIKHLHEFWSKSRLEYWAFAEKKAKEDWEYKQRFNL